MISSTPMYRACDATTGVVIAAQLRAAHTHWTRLKGLLGTRSLEPGEGLWIKPCNQVHMFGMRYAIDVVFLDADHCVVRAIAGLAPGKVSPRVRAATTVLELPEGTLARAGVQEGAYIAIEGGASHGRRTAPPKVLPFWVRCAGWVLGSIVVTSLLVLFARAHMTWGRPCPEFICYWAAGKLLAAGQSPYDLASIAKVQHEYGWDKARDGFGYYDFLPYYYPPSLLGVVSVLLVPLGFTTARIAWLVINAELFLISGYMLRNAVAGVPPVVPMVLVPIFMFSVASVMVGQVTALVFFLMVAAWMLVKRRWDRSAGWVLAWLSIKPQLSTLLVLTTLLWLIRQRRWQALRSFAAGAILLLAVSLWWLPSWPLDILRDVGRAPLVNMMFPWAGTSWLLVLRSLGLQGWLLWVLYAALAAPFCWAVLRCALRRRSTIDEVYALSILAAFFVAPTIRSYDQPILIIPLLVLLGTRISGVIGTVVLAAFIVLPYAHVAFAVPSINRITADVWFFWVPLLLAGVWFGSHVLQARAD